jgi:hypothetical protein
MSARMKIIGKSHPGAQKDVVIYGDTIKNHDLVLHRDSITEHDSALDIGAITDIAVAAYPGSFEYMSKCPHSCAGPDMRTFADTLGMHVYIAVSA